MEFEIKVTQTIESPKSKFRADLNELQEFIEERLKGKSYGTAVTKYFWGFELFKFNGDFAFFFRNEIESWKHSRKWLVTNSNFDWDLVKKLNEKDTLQLLKDELLISIDRIDNMKRKPKDFDKKRFRKDIEETMDEYLKFKNKSIIPPLR